MAGVPGGPIVSRVTIEVEFVGSSTARDSYKLTDRKRESVTLRDSMQIEERKKLNVGMLNPLRY